MKSIIFSLSFIAASMALATPKGRVNDGQCISSPNNCDLTAPCSGFGGKLYCGCRPGYKATQASDSDSSKQWRIDTLKGHEHRVWVLPGVVCGSPCKNPFSATPCSEVIVSNSGPVLLAGQYPVHTG